MLDGHLHDVPYTYIYTYIKHVQLFPGIHLRVNVLHYQNAKQMITMR